MQESTYQDKIEEYHNWNFTLNIASAGFDNFGMSLVGVTTVLPAFLTLFTKSNLVIGFLPALFVFFWTFPQIMSSLYTGHLRQKKNTIVFIRIGYALPWLILSICTLFFIRPGSPMSLVIFFMFFSIFALLGGFAMPTWVSFISRLIFPNVRGRFFALRVFVGTSFGILASFIVKGLLDRYKYPFNFSLIFIMTFSMFLLGTIFLAISKEPLIPSQPRRKSFAEYFSGLGTTIKRDRPLGWFIISIVIRSFGAYVMAAAFYTVYAINKLNINLGQAGIFMGIMLSAQMVSSLVIGYISDRKGPKMIQAFARLFEFLSVGAILLVRDIMGVYIAFGFLGLAQSSMLISYYNMIIELAPRDKVDIYMGIVNTIRAPSLAVAPLLGGFLIDTFSYRSVFMIALFASLISGLVLLWIPLASKR